MTSEVTIKTGAQPRKKSDATLDLLEVGKDELTPLEQFQIRFIRKSLERGRLDSSLRFLQRHIGANWIGQSTKNLRHVHGLDRLPELNENDSFVVVSNHRSFFDLYVVTAHLVKGGLPHRILFPVRSNFFYDKALGFFVNGAMSFFAMYPPVFRERKRAPLNLAGIDETIRILRKGGSFIGLHPEGTRNLSDDPYTLLPGQPGVGRIIHGARVKVLPVFVNGLGNDMVKQLAANYMKTGSPVNVVFGAPVDFGDLLDRPGSPRTYREISQRTCDAIAALGQEEKKIRAVNR
ncbi:MAG: lysophospholipid acyltransferase family protein [Polyangiaceae bacterium]